MVWTRPERLEVPVQGGLLRAGRWGSGAPFVLASHGITANHLAFAEVAGQLATLGGGTLVAVDHRGRGGSADLPGPFGLGAHVRDLLAVLDHLEVPRATLVGHSMGAYVAALTAEAAPDRVTAVVLVDGALPIEVSLPPDTDLEAVVRSVIGPALDRLDRTFDSPDEYVATWREHPAVGGAYFTELVEAYVRYDLVEAGGVWRSGVSKDAVLEDGAGPFRDEAVRTVLARVPVPATLLWAPRGLLDQEPGLFAPDQVAAVATTLPSLAVRRVDDVNHYSIVFDPRGAREVAAAVSGGAAGTPGA
jgi:pimeloyl-ACP methyl ester carboxylesterase